MTTKLQGVITEMAGNLKSAGFTTGKHKSEIIEMLKGKFTLIKK